MESILLFICEYSFYAPYIFFALLLLSGFSIPVSEDLVLLIAGAFGSLCQHESESILKLYIWVFLGSWLSAWEAYWIGRFFGPKILTINWFKKIITPKRLAKIKLKIERFGIFIFFIGRFMPGGMRNTLYMTSGLTKMPFKLFLLRDVGACLLSTATFFYVGHFFGRNYQEIAKYFKIYEETILVSVVVVVVVLTFFFARK